MAITVPIQGTPVSAAAFGIPVANEINRLTPLVDSHATQVNLSNAVAWTPTTIWAGATGIALTTVTGWSQKVGGMFLAGCRGYINGSGPAAAAIQFPTPYAMSFGVGTFYFHQAGVRFYDGMLRMETTSRFSATKSDTGGPFGTEPSLTLKVGDNFDLFVWGRYS